ncbi:heat shock 70 kDa protein 12A-like [Mercenaria mercenaria]|uniref:heat shock 70 kDa protein 12A-like n=1 Tax=Mercenaria mercenaria TaxID=6596 RepID=UPI00234F3D55|nr:heat shock 70 kDa protein 12A-like [Mercenaria mercenaria]
MANPSLVIPERLSQALVIPEHLSRTGGDGLKLKDISFVSAIRKSAGDNKPGVVVATFKSHKDKRRVMMEKIKLKDNRLYDKVYINHDLSPAECLMTNNFRMALNGLKQHGLTLKGNRVVRKDSSGGDRSRWNDRSGSPVQTRRNNEVKKAVPVEVLKSEAAVYFLHVLLNVCFDSGTVPSLWGKSIINPIPKSATADPRDPLSYKELTVYLKSFDIGIDVGGEKVCILLYADDIVLLSSNPNDLQLLLNALSSWCDANDMTVNCKYHKAQPFRKEIEAEDQLGQRMPLIYVVAKLIEALKNHFIDSLKQKGQNMETDKILWVVTVPAIWSNEAKSLMRQAAEKSGINKKNLLLALEPEAAAIYCIHLPDEQRANMNDLGTPGQVFLTADLGGLTADLSAVKVLEDGFLKEICRAKGELAGGQNVNDAFFQVCYDSFEGNSWKETFKKATPTEMLDMEDDFEQKKVKIGITDRRAENITLKVPYVVRKEIENDTIRLKKTSDINKKLMMRNDELTFNSEFIRNTLFKETCLNICKIMQKELEKEGLRECRTIVLVGGFAESPIAVQHIREMVEESFPQIKVVVPTSPFQAVLKGAVLYGHDPMIFRSRISRFTYGIGTNSLFNEKIHDANKKWLNTENKKLYCKDILSVHVEKGQSVILKEQLEHRKYQPMYKDQKSFHFSIFASTEVSKETAGTEEPENIMYTTDEGCQRIGEVEVQSPNTSRGTDRNLLVTMVYGGTELSVIAKDETSGNEVNAEIKFSNM